MISAGELRHRIQIQSPSTSQDSVGQPTAEWTTYHTCWAKIATTKNTFLFQTNEFTSKTSFVISIRYQPGVTISVADRILFKGEVYEIEFLDNVKQLNQEVRLTCHVLNDSTE